MKKLRINSNGPSPELACRDEGAGLPIIFLHAFPLSQRMWDEQITAFSLANRVITFDWRGFGESELCGDSFLMETFADDLAGLMDGLKIDRAVVCGLSMGGYAAFAFYRTYADRVAALILSDTRAGTDTEEGKRGRYEMADKALQTGSSAIAEIVISKLLGPLTLQHKPQVIATVKAVIAANRPEAIAAAQRGMAERQDSTDLLSKISCPTLIIVGSDDALTPPSEAEKMHNQIPGSTFVIINQAGHLPNLEQPEEFNRVVADFLKQL